MGAAKRKFDPVIPSVVSTPGKIDAPGHLRIGECGGLQSSGKSSLIEAISGINLPRAAGTCTRVPIEVRLRQEEDKDWKCVVKIRREVNEQGQDNVEDEKAEVDFGPIITEPTEVEATIRRAQLAILNPSVPTQSFVTYDLPKEEVDKPLGSTKQLAFSRNVIVLEISGPNVTDLTLVDLPGIIQNVGKNEDKGNIQLVEDLVKSYIAKDCLILLVLTMKDDIQNQKAALLATEVDPDGKRTIGVLTKVDTLRGREVDLWVKVLKNETEPLLHGYYVTRQPDADELAEGISFDAARGKEADFFSQTAPWNGLSSGWKQRLGTKNLTASLSDQLLSFIREKLPDLITHINEKYDLITDDLDSLGKEPSNDPVNEMMSLLTDFTASLDAKIVGQPGHEAFMQDVKAAFMRYKQNVWATAPRFSPYTKGQLAEAGDGQMDVVLRDYAGDIEEVKEGDMGRGGANGKVMTLTDVRMHIQKSVTRELPKNVPFPAKAQLIRQFTATWGRLARDLMATIRPMMELILEKAVKESFGRYSEGMLPAAVSEIIKDKVRSLAEQAQLQINKLIELDERPFTMNDHYLNDVRAKILAHLKDKRYPKPAVSDEAQRQLSTKTVLAELNHVSYPGVQEDDLAKLRPTDDYETELDVMAEIRAYWQVAYKRVIDNVPRIIDAEFIVPMAKQLHPALLKDLSILTDDGNTRCRKFLAESPLNARRREDLNQRRDRLGQAKEAIRGFGTK